MKDVAEIERIRSSDMTPLCVKLEEAHVLYKYKKH